MFAENWGQAHNDAGESSFDMLVRIGDELLDVRQDAGHDQTLAISRVEGLTEILHLISSCSPDFGFRIFQKGL